MGLAENILEIDDGLVVSFSENILGFYDVWKSGLDAKPVPVFFAKMLLLKLAGLFWNIEALEVGLVAANGFWPPLPPPPPVPPLPAVFYLKLEVGLNEYSPAFFVRNEEGSVFLNYSLVPVFVKILPC